MAAAPWAEGCDVARGSRCNAASERASELQTALAAERDATRRQTEAAFQSRLEEEKQRVAAEAAEQVQVRPSPPCCM